MYSQNNSYRQGRYNDHRDSDNRNSHRDDRNTDSYYNSGSRRQSGNDRYEDDRYQMSHSRGHENDYGPFSNIYSNEHTDRRNDSDSRYNTTDNNYYYENSRPSRHSDEAYGKSFKDIFSGRNHRDHNNDYDRDYNSGYNSTGHSYQNDERNNNDDRNFFERAGDRIKHTWNDMTHRDDRNDRNYGYDENRYERNYSDRDKEYNNTGYTNRRRYEDSY